ncbi:hypothetical protein SCLCIDRAFT_1140208 [Scleroderma citrinum Foug A]|uniref:Uncharacterized protein n=1 Tax=Scleroderma citrinum Foug A TaxID=1036808 RepID=A0A0C2Z5Q8_9AGAM|nr:hypothetical protein SCLCIDRAFT_1140208 [Scleroderma citrinum Foug A]
MKREDDQGDRMLTFKTIQLTLRFAHECSIGRSPFDPALCAALKIMRGVVRIAARENNAGRKKSFSLILVSIWQLAVIMKWSQYLYFEVQTTSTLYRSLCAI